MKNVVGKNNKLDIHNICYFYKALEKMIQDSSLLKKKEQCWSLLLFFEKME